MSVLSGSDLLRVAIFSGALGFAVFCASYSLLVWRNRNKRLNTRSRWARHLALACAALGVFGLLITWAFSTIEKREGLAGGNDLFVVHARRDNSALRLIAQDEVAAGDVIAEFVPPANETELSVKTIQQEQAQVRREAMRAKVLPIDQALVQRELQIRTQITQEEGFLLELQKSRGEAEKARSNLLTEWTREKNQITGDISSTEEVLNAAKGRLELARTALEQASDAFKRQIITKPIYDSRRANFINAEGDVNSQQATLSSLKARLQALEERFNQSNTALGQQLAQIDENSAKFSASLAADRAQLAEMLRVLDGDRARARTAVDREVKAAELDTSIAAAEKERSIEVTQVKAPFSGRVVFRNPSPGLAADGAPVLAVSAGAGFNARVRLPQAEADELAAQGKSVPLMLEHAVLHNVITAKFVRTEPLPADTGEVIATFECTLPAEVVAGLGNPMEPIKVRLLWKPTLSKQTGFQASAAMAVLGLVGLLVSGIRSRPTRQAEAVSETSSATAAQPVGGIGATPASGNGLGAHGEIVDLRSRRTLVQHRGGLVPKDPVTGLIDHEQFLAIAEAEVKASAEAGTALSVLMVGIDRLRETNAAYGRKVGDAVLKEVADLCRGSRERDVSARWTGETFVVLLPETDQAGATVVANRLRSRMQQLRVRDIPHLQNSISTGVSEVRPGETTVLPALERAAEQRDAQVADSGAAAAPLSA